MNTFFDNNNKSDIGKLIHVGAGNGIELNDYTAQSFTEILLLEPIPKVFKQLESKLGKLNEINVQCKMSALNVALSSSADKNKEKVFYLTLPNRYSSLHKADKLKTLFQNLKTEQEITVSPINFSDLINQSSLDKGKKNALVLQINGAEFEVLAQAETDELMLFSSIVIQHSNNNYFENAKTSTDLIALMKSKGFQLAIETNNDVVFSSLVFRKDESTLKLKTLTEQGKTQTTRIAELESQLKASNEAKAGALNKATELETQTSEQNKNKNNRISELENQLKASNEAKAGALNKASELETQLSEQNKNKNNRISELENQLKASNEAKAGALNKASELETQISEQNKNKNNRISELENQLKAINEAKAGALNKASELETQISEQNKNKNNRISELENQLKASNEAKAGELNKASEFETQIAEQNKNKNNRISELENQLKASNEAKSGGVNKLKALETINSTLESEKQELIYRQTILDTEIVKVEAQLELIKDVVLREKAF